MNKINVLLTTACVLIFATGVHAGLAAVGPIDPVSGFPVWFQDSNGVALELWPFQDPVTGLPNPYTISAPPDPNNAYSSAIGFGDEGFWWAAEAQLSGLNGESARLILAQEAAFMGDASAVFGNQFAFGRLRIRIDDCVQGTYTVTHPYGTHTFEVLDPNEDDRIFYTNDNGDLYPYLNNRVLGGPVGPFLTSLDANVPAGFVGDPAVSAPVTGSPNGFNKFRLQGPGGFDVETDLFSVMGKRYTGTALDVQGGELLLEQGLLRATVIGDAAGDNTLTVTGGVLAADLINADVLQQGGTLAPGNSPGVSDIHGGYLLAASATLQIEIAGPAGKGNVNGHDFVRVRGHADLRGAIELLVTDEPTLTIGQEFQILRYDMLAGQFDGLGQGDLVESGRYGFVIDYGSGVDDSITLTLAQVPEPSVLVLLSLGTVLMLRHRKLVANQ